MKMFLILLVLMAAGPALGDDRPAGHVALRMGDAWIERMGERMEVSAGTPVFQADLMVTGRRGRLKVLFTDDALVSLGSNSRVLVTRHLFDPDSASRATRLELLAGKLRALVQKMVAGSQADFQVKTSNAVAGVRGTEFILEMEGGQTRLYTLTGEVALGGEGAEPVLVAAGQSSRTDASGHPGLAQAVAAAELDKLRQDTDSDYEAVALAMAQPPAPTDRLSRSSEGSLSTSSSPDQEIPEGVADFVTDEGTGPPLGAETDGRDGFGNSYFGGPDDTQGGYPGIWENPEPNPDASLVRDTQVKLVIRLHR